VAHRIPDKIKHLVYVDAILPVDGESVLDLGTEDSKEFFLNIAKSQGEGYSIPPLWPNPGKDVPHPIASFQQQISLEDPKAETIPGSYILTIEPGRDKDDFVKYAERAKTKGYKYFELPTGHNPQRSMPIDYANILIRVGSDN
jgi:hypothetical protein